MKSIAGRFSAFVAIAALIGGCNGVSSPPPSDGGVDRADVADAAAAASFEGQPSIRGTITQVDGSTIRVEEVPAEESGSAKATVRIPAGTSIRNSDGSGAEVADLEVGDQVSVWFVGPVAESYPVQATAGSIEIGA